MQALGLGTDGDRIVYRAARDIPARFRVTMNVDDEGGVHLKGATDTAGSWRCGKDNCRKRYPCAQHGTHGDPVWQKGRTIDPLNAAWGFTDGDVADVRAELRGAGVKKTAEETFALLCMARFALDGGRLPRKRGVKMTPEQRREYERVRKRRRRLNLRDAGICVVCGVNPVSIREDGALGSTCYYCGAAANERKRKPAA